jgi:two-component system, cell cycle sensor histidine kinase and response regulator CckA
MDHTIANHGGFGKLARIFPVHTPAMQFGVALFFCGLAAGGNLVFPALSSQLPLLLFFMATCAATWLGGFRAGLLATILSVLIIDFYFPQPGGFLSGHGIGLFRLVGFAFIMAVIAWLIDSRAQSGQLIKTQRGQVEEQERRHRALVSSAARLAGIGSWEYDIAGDSLMWDDETIRIFGATRESFGGNIAAFFALVHPDDREALKAMQTKALASNGITEMEYRILRPDGAIRLVYDRGQVTRHEDGKPAQSIGMVMDVTEQRKAAEDLREIKERYDAAVLGSASGLWDWNIQTNEVFYAPRFKEMLGYEDDEFPGVLASFVDHVHPDDQSGASLAVKQHLRDRLPFNVEYRLRTKSGEYRWFNARAQALWNAEGWAYRMAGSIVDISERRLLEERYHQSQRLEAIGRLAGGIAHDFNNMLGVILVHCDGLHEALPIDSPEWQSVRQIKMASTRSADLTRQLLAFSRKQILLPSILDLNATVNEISFMVNSLIGDDIELIVRPGEGLERVKADPGQIHQVVMNLMVNARDAMPHGGQILIETKNVHWEGQQLPSNLQVTPGTYVMLSVSDNGSGMEPDVLQHIFEPFYTTKQQGEGTGLGLATVYGIVKQSEGYVVAESQPGKGTTFKIYLPKVEAELSAHMADPPKADLTGGDETILLAEDEPLLREIFRMQLEDAGYTVLEAPNGKEATRVAQHHHKKIHLLLTDLVMAGGTNGLELAAQLNTTQPGIKVVYMTGYTADVIDPKGMAVMQDRILQKPFSSASLLRKIREVLAG